MHVGGDGGVSNRIAPFCSIPANLRAMSSVLGSRDGAATRSTARMGSDRPQGSSQPQGLPEE